MYDFFAENSLYVVLFVVLTIWAGIAYMLVRLEKKVAKLEREQSERPAIDS